MDGENQSSNNADVKWTDKVTAVAAILAVGLSIWSLLQSCGSNRIAQESNSIARTAQAYNVTQDARQFTPKIEINHYLAKSPDLLVEQDAQWVSRRQLVPLLVQSRFWLAERSQYKDDSQERYLFIFIINHGPGRLERVNLSSINWIPKKDQQVPTGLTVEGPLGLLPSGAFYALLVDVLESPDPIEYMKSTRFESLEFTISIKDELGHEAQYPVNMGNVQAGVPTPGPFNYMVP